MAMCFFFFALFYLFFFLYVNMVKLFDFTVKLQHFKGILDLIAERWCGNESHICLVQILTKQFLKNKNKRKNHEIASYFTYSLKEHDRAYITYHLLSILPTPNPLCLKTFVPYLILSRSFFSVRIQSLFVSYPFDFGYVYVLELKALML